MNDLNEGYVRVNFMHRFASLALCLLTGFTFAAQPSQPVPQTAGATKDPSSHGWKLEQAISCSVAEAWDLGGKTEEGFLEILKLWDLFRLRNGDLPFPRPRRLERPL
jgi:hypothetical protein